jgi:hypothetical protein
MTPVVAAACALWGALVGFVGWAGIFRVIEPISDWLVPLAARADTARGIVRLFVALFLILATIAALAIVPMMLTGADAHDVVDPSVRRDSFGVAFVGSIVGAFLNGLIGRFWGDAHRE